MKAIKATLSTLRLIGVLIVHYDNIGYDVGAYYVFNPHYLAS